MRIERIGDCTLYNGNMRDVLGTLPGNSVDSIVCDPPYHLTSIVKRFADGAPAQYGKDGAFQRASAGFMGKQWDGGDIAFQPETWAACLRVLKPGGYILAFASTRGFGRMSVALEDAGFITHPFVAWIFGSGFPKATQTKVEGMEGWRYGGQALKPAIEPIYMGQKPFSEKTGTANIKRWGTGAINIDGCRVGTDENLNGGAYATEGGRVGLDGDEREGATAGMFQPGKTADRDYRQPAGRWPANIVHDGSDEVLAAFPETGPAKAGNRGLRHSGRHGGVADLGGNIKEGTDTVRGINDNGGSAARFFYTAKASRKDREDGLESHAKSAGGMVSNTSGQHITRRDEGYNPEPRANTHPTVKPTSLMEYLVRLVTPPNGTVLDPFMGSGSTGKAAVFEGFKFIGIERESEYLDIAKARIAWAANYKDEPPTTTLPVAAQAQPASAPDNDNLPLFRSAA